MNRSETKIRAIDWRAVNVKSMKLARNVSARFAPVIARNASGSKMSPSGSRVSLVDILNDVTQQRRR